MAAAEWSQLLCPFICLCTPGHSKNGKFEKRLKTEVAVTGRRFPVPPHSRERRNALKYKVKKENIFYEKGRGGCRNVETTLKQTRKNKNYCAHLNSLFAVLCFAVELLHFVKNAKKKKSSLVAKRKSEKWFILCAELSWYSNYHTTLITMLYQLFSSILWIVTTHPSRGIQNSTLEAERSGLTL